MTRADLLALFNGCHDGPMRFLRRVSCDDEQHLFAGNQSCREKLLKAGFISIVEHRGQYWRLRITDDGRVALAADKLLSTISTEVSRLSTLQEDGK